MPCARVSYEYLRIYRPTTVTKYLIYQPSCHITSGVGLAEDADFGEKIGTFKATSLYSPSDIVYRLEPPVKVLNKDNSEQVVTDDIFRLESTSSGAVIYINNVNSTYKLHNAARFSFHVVAVDLARTNASATAAVEVES